MFPYPELQIITLSDLECDYINARSCCSKLNKWVVPEVIGHAVVTVLMLISLHWFIFLLNLPVATWNIYRYIMVPSGNMGVFDPTEIHNRGQLKSHMKEAMIKLGFHLLCFFMYLYSMILALINDWEVEREPLAAKLGHHSSDWLWSHRHLPNTPRSVSSCSIFFLFEQEIFFCIFNIKYFQKTLDLCSSCFCSFTSQTAGAAVRWNPSLQKWPCRN